MTSHQDESQSTDWLFFLLTKRQVGAQSKVTLEIEAEIPSGAPENVVRTVTENSRTLKFNSHGFQKK